MAHVGGREELSLLDVDDPPGARRGDDQIGLPREKRRNLEDVGDLGGGRGMRRLVDVGEDRRRRAFSLTRPRTRSPSSSPGRETTARTCGSPCRTTP